MNILPLATGSIATHSGKRHAIKTFTVIESNTQAITLKLNDRNKTIINIALNDKSTDREYSLAELEAMPTLHQGQTDDLKFDNQSVKVWLSRLTIEDGMPYNNQVTIEMYDDKGAWVISKKYEAK